MHILIQGCFKLHWALLKYSWSGRGQLKSSSCEIYNRLIKADAFCIISNLWLVRSLEFFINTYTFPLANVCVYLYIYNFFFKCIPICTLTLRTFCFYSPCDSVTCLSCAPCCLPNAVHHKFTMACQAKEGIELLYEEGIFANRTSYISQWNFLMLPYYSCTKLLGSYRSDIKNSN